MKASACLWISLTIIACGFGGGCSVSLPMGSLVSSNSHDDDEAGSALKPQLAGLHGEDWQRAKAAMASALGGDGAMVPWDNPQSGTKGSFTAIGDAYTTHTGTCRGFQAAIDRNDVDDRVQGTACARKSGDWQITDVKATNPKS